MRHGTIAYLTDVEGRGDKLASFVEGNAHVWLHDGALRLADGVTFVFGGDAIDRGPDARRIVRLLLAAKRTYGERVVLLAGNRDINKLRLWRELRGAPPERTPIEIANGPRPALLRWIFERTMGAKDAFAHRATELAAEGRAASDDDVVESFLEDLGPGGELRAYLASCRLVFRAGATLFVHGGVTEASLGVVPGRVEPLDDVDVWAHALDALYAHEMATFAAGGKPSTLIAYQAPLSGTHANQASVVYGRLADAHGDPHLPSRGVIARLRRDGIGRLVVGHTPSGDCPALLRDGDFELVLADSSHGRIERGSQVVLTDDRIEVSAATELDDGRRLRVRFESARSDGASPLGKRDRATGRLVKARADGEGHLLFRGLPGHRVEQTLASEASLARSTLEAPHAR